MVSWLKHAFAVDPPGPSVPTDDEKRVVERLAGEIVRRGLTAPALLFLESSRPLNFLGSQVLVFCAPFAEVFFKAADYRTLTGFLERRGSVEYACRRIEFIDIRGVQTSEETSADASQSQESGPAA